MRPVRTEDVEGEISLALERDDAERVEGLGKHLDLLDVAVPPVSMLSAALWYAEQGLHVFPLMPGSKLPLPRSHGFEDATTERDQIVACWTKEPLRNVGIATGHVVDVVDIDGPQGQESLARHLLDAKGNWTSKVPILGTVSTPRPGGKHLYVPINPSTGNRTHFFPGIDYRGLGGYVVAPPSVLDDRAGQRPGRYQWVIPLSLET